MHVTIANVLQVLDLLEGLVGEEGLFEVLLIFLDLEGLKVGVMCKGPCTHGSKTMEGLWHVNTCHCDDITWSTSSGVASLRYNAHSSRYVAYWNLFRGLLDFDLLVANELA